MAAVCGCVWISRCDRVLCGMAPALAGMRTEVLDSLRDGSHAAGQGRSQYNLQSILVMLEIALALLLLVASGPAAPQLSKDARNRSWISAATCSDCLSVAAKTRLSDAAESG